MLPIMLIMLLPPTLLLLLQLLLRLLARIVLDNASVLLLFAEGKHRYLSPMHCIVVRCTPQEKISIISIIILLLLL